MGWVHIFEKVAQVFQSPRNGDGGGIDSHKLQNDIQEDRRADDPPGENPGESVAPLASARGPADVRCRQGADFQNQLPGG